MNKKLSEAPFAVGSDGIVFVNVTHLVGEVGVTTLIQQARRMARVLFVGVAVTRGEKKQILGAIDNAGAEAVAKVAWSRQRVMRRGRRSLRRASR